MMKKLLYIIIALIGVSNIYAQPFDVRATCKSHGMTIQAWVSPTQSPVNFNSGTNNTMAVSVLFSLPANGATNTTNAPVVQSVTSPYGTPQLFQGVNVFLLNDRYNYFRFVPFTGGIAFQPAWAVNSEHLVMEMTFSNLAGTFPRLDNCEFSPSFPLNGNAYFYFEMNGTERRDLDIPFYTINGMMGNYPTTFDFWVEPLLPLPIKLLSFTAEKSGDNKSTALTWSTASESNSSYFGIERSTDRINWKTVGKVNAAGNSQIVVNYEYLDKNVNIGSQSNLIVYYRLKMVDRDDSFEYSPIESVNFGNGRDVLPKENEFLVYPNPAAEGIHVEWDSRMADQPTQLEFYDISGKLVHVEKVADQSNQQYVDFTKANIQSGLCLMRIMSGDKSIQYKQIVVGKDH